MVGLGMEKKNLVLHTEIWKTFLCNSCVTLEEAIADSERGNRLGRERGRNNPTCDCHILMQDLLPKNKK